MQDLIPIPEGRFAILVNCGSWGRIQFWLLNQE